MNLANLQENLENLILNFSKEEFIFDLLSAYEIPKSTIKLLRNNPSKLSGKDNEVILKNKLLFHATSIEEDEHVAIDNIQRDNSTYKYNPRFIIVTDYVTFLAVDTKTKETLDISIGELGKHYAFFLPWMGMEKAQHVTENPADIRAAYRMDKLYQAIVQDNEEYYQDHSHDLNVFLSRLLFCFFAEDTGIFTKGLFTNSIISHTPEDGKDLDNYFKTLFTVLNTQDSDRSQYAQHFKVFPYVNGGLFEKDIQLPIFSANSRKLIIECGKLNWDSINPDIFGSMIQAVVHPGQRENLGMHYTSVPNIMKVIEPLFLNELYEEFENAENDPKKLNKLRERIAQIRIFDPACGSGNFLIISYRELCKLEAKILRTLNDSRSQLFEGWTLSSVSLNNFFGIEIDDFAHEIAKLSLYLAQHQVNLEFEKEFGKLKPILPLKESGRIVCANATKVDWNTVCPKVEYGLDGKNIKRKFEIYVLGNPPYYGARKQDLEQKLDINRVFQNQKNASNLDYIACWFYLGKKYIENTDISLAFVSTNSITQGEQVSILWPMILQDNVEISFAYQSFKWKNSAKGNAGVTCVIIGLRTTDDKPKYIFNEKIKVSVKNISPYLVEGDNVYIQKRNKPLSSMPEMCFGSMPNDGGFLLLDQNEYIDIKKNNPEALKFIRKCYGGQEFIKGIDRYCFWITESELDEALKIGLIKERVNKVRIYRNNSDREATKKLALKPYKFGEIRHVDSNSIIVPATSSENRDYIPVGFLDSKAIITNSANAIYNTEAYIFAILNSRMHMVWVRSVGGKLKTDIRYSSVLCYNTFPFPNITAQQKESLTGHVYNILEEREKYPEKTLAELYDPHKMPVGLKDAHHYLDLAVDQIYRNKPFENDEERLSHLFKLYEDMITKENIK